MIEYLLLPEKGTTKYAKGVELLKDFDMERPLTFKETIQSIVEAYKSGSKSLGGCFVYTCTGVAYKAYTSDRFKILPIAQALISISPYFHDYHMKIDYDSLDGIEVVRCGRYYTKLTQQEVLVHEGWLAALEGDKALFNTYSDIVWTECGMEKAMRFLLLEPLSKEHRAKLGLDLDYDRLLPLGVDALTIGSDACGDTSFENLGGRFVAKRIVRDTLVDSSLGYDTKTAKEMQLNPQGTD